jgi:Fe-S-cluster containining protein
MSKDPIGSKVVPIRKDGSCGHLAPDGACSIYDDRPWFCRTNIARKHLKPDTMSDREFVRRMAAGCNHIQKKLRIPPRFRVRVW